MSIDLEAQEHAWEMAEQRTWVDKFLKLNKRELFTLARHFKIPHVKDFADGWSQGGKQELAFEIARAMVERS